MSLIEISPIFFSRYPPAGCAERITAIEISALAEIFAFET